MASRLRFLGSGDSQGVPRWWCGCSVCQEARATGLNARTRPSVWVEGSEQVLIDVAPEFRLQATREGLRRFDAVLITHAHNDHILGLGDVADRARWTKEPCPAYAPREVLPQLQQRFAYLFQGTYLERIPFRALEDAGRTFAGYAVSAVKVPHGYNGWSYAFRFDGPHGSWAYMPDCIGLEDLEPWRGLDLLVLGTSFYKEPAPVASRSVYDVTEAVELVSRLKPARTVFTHLSHGIDRRKPAPEGAMYAHDGLVLELP
ncbi:Phosphoribosyl 1,2-cyclic phosphate phosphodiesterase [Calidithermus terrae]|uniref:Phosphoribosyl 1,2-cyclic phosphate phosphodiesterase n=1 Tax=Calidithermus terrae TaxID=1408545 RepID=A0A399EET2_9DEIN|nr:MBL fold metallo-hydrolase [Calidithermus terrae]RIH83144.1 Phosphoribosyl 1,2-cyclic phosphate phosphodiesterase [Calidithermus terrae]